MTTSILENQIGLRQLASDTFAARCHSDWAVGPGELSMITCTVVRVSEATGLCLADGCLFTTLAILGGCVAAIIQLTAQTYLRTDPVLVKVNQPDVLNLHLEFLRVCTHDDSTIKVVPLKIGATVSTLQLQLL